MKIDIKPLSVNCAWQGRRFKTKHYLLYETELYYKLPNIKIPNCHISIDIEFGFSNKSSDIDNCVKPFIDILQKRYNFNDKIIYEMVLHKTIVKKGEEYIEFNIKEYDKKIQTN